MAHWGWKDFQGDDVSRGAQSYICLVHADWESWKLVEDCQAFPGGG